MYYPYLRGKQFELIALREFSKEAPTPSHVCPIIEPVKSSFNGLKTAIDTLSSNNISFALVLNPTEGDFRRKQQDILENLPVLRDLMGWIPAFIYKGNGGNIETYIATNSLNDIMIIFQDSIDLSKEDVSQLLKNNSIKYIVANIEGDRRNRRLLAKSGKELIRLDDQFHEQPRNADYLNIPEEKFTEEHKYYSEEGYKGFSDYVTLPSSFKESGMLPYAVAIHMTYEKNEDEIFVRHFVSDRNSDNTNIPGKFYEAATKLKAFYTGIPGTQASSELITILDANRYPGLGVLKKLSIKNHLELIEKYLTRQK